MSQAQGFWLGGHDEYIKALRQEEKERLAPLKRQHKFETDPQIKRSLKAQIKALQAEFKQKRKAADRSLFTAD